MAFRIRSSSVPCNKSDLEPCIYVISYRTRALTDEEHGRLAVCHDKKVHLAGWLAAFWAAGSGRSEKAGDFFPAGRLAPKVRAVRRKSFLGLWIRVGRRGRVQSPGPCPERPGNSHDCCVLPFVPCGSSRKAAGLRLPPRSAPRKLAGARPTPQSGD